MWNRIAAGSPRLAVPGVDLLAYRATEADPLDLVRAARKGTDGYLAVAGSIDSPERIRAVAEAGADGFTIGTAALEGAFSPRKGSLASQLLEILEACKRWRRAPRRTAAMREAG